MNPQRYEYARNRCINKLSGLDHELFKFVEKKELALADQAQTEDQFVQLLQERSPIFEAASLFSMDASDVFERIQKIECWIDEEVPKMLDKLKLVDFTELIILQGRVSADKKMKFFYLRDD
ncbi:hypothetical protein [Salipaludibacillus daqingensis]|uniref:hypothetical protein n=1 Tax=Salipaludibacillus daqingensis TaxID=3041001 RepID=UPI002476EF5E|nr:hypothetical protein [Salipaludibacillus daqingensis]